MKILSILILSTLLSACVGVGVFTPTSNLVSDTTGKTAEWVASANKWRSEQRKISKDGEFEVWAYENNDWCGALVVIIPLMLPVCDSTDSYYFKDNVLVKHEVRMVKMSGAFCSVYPVCKTPDDCSLCLAN